jgi:hypothetical protein
VNVQLFRISCTDSNNKRCTLHHVAGSFVVPTTRPSQKNFWDRVERDSEEQAFVYVSKLHMAEMLRRLDRKDQAQQLYHPGDGADEAVQ